MERRGSRSHRSSWSCRKNTRTGFIHTSNWEKLPASNHQKKLLPVTYLLSELKEEGPSLSRRCSSGPCCVSRCGSEVRGGCG